MDDNFHPFTFVFISTTSTRRIFQVARVFFHKFRPVSHRLQSWTNVCLYFLLLVVRDSIVSTKVYIAVLTLCQWSLVAYDLVCADSCAASTTTTNVVVETVLFAVDQQQKQNKSEKVVRLPHKTCDVCDLLINISYPVSFDVSVTLFHSLCVIRNVCYLKWRVSW